MISESEMKCWKLNWRKEKMGWKKMGNMGTWWWWQSLFCCRVLSRGHYHSKLLRTDVYQTIPFARMVQGPWDGHEAAGNLGWMWVFLGTKDKGGAWTDQKKKDKGGAWLFMYLHCSSPCALLYCYTHYSGASLWHISSLCDQQNVGVVVSNHVYGNALEGGWGWVSGRQKKRQQLMDWWGQVADSVWRLRDKTRVGL